MNHDDEERRIYYVRDVARMLGVSPSRVYERVARGLIPASRLGGRVIFKRAVFDRWLDGADDVAMKLAK